MAKKDYTTTQIEWLLRGYTSLAEGQHPRRRDFRLDYNSGSHSRHQHVIPPISPLDLKADIDRALQRLDDKTKLIIALVDILEMPDTCSSWLKLSYRQIFIFRLDGIRAMERFLNGRVEKRGGYRRGAGRKIKTG